ncbi:MAG: hypothetical protein ACYDCS_14310 [Candidatus Dormibacteria bacterium]
MSTADGAFRRASLWLAALLAGFLAGCGASSTPATATPTAAIPQATPTQSTPTPTATSPSPTATPTPAPTPTATPVGQLTISSVGINVPLDGACGDQLTYAPIGSQVCYWNLTAGGGGFFSFAGTATGPLSALSRAAAGAVVTWSVAGKSYARKLSGRAQTFPLDTGHDVPPGQPAYLQIRTATTVVEYDAET